MPEYIFEIEVLHEFQQLTIESVTVEANDFETAKTYARQSAEEQAEYDIYEADHECSYVSSINLTNTNDIENIDKIPKCSKTPDMFNNLI